MGLASAAKPGHIWQAKGRAGDACVGPRPDPRSWLLPTGI